MIAPITVAIVRLNNRGKAIKGQFATTSKICARPQPLERAADRQVKSGFHTILHAMSLKFFFCVRSLWGGYVHIGANSKKMRQPRCQFKIRTPVR